MELLVGGWRVEVGPETALSTGERRALETLSRGTHQRLGTGPATTITLVDERPFPPEDAAEATRVPAPAPAAVRAHDGRLRVSHSRFCAELDPVAGTGRLWRREADGLGLWITLRIALAAALPRNGGLPLHAAGIVVAGRGLAFFGPSGAGKSTLAATARARGLAVLSDEQVTLLAEPALLAPSGFWGELDGAAPAGAAPLVALFELDRGPVLELERLAPEAALRRLLGVLLVPPEPGLWRCALALAGRFARQLPIYRLTWNPAQPPWDELPPLLEALGAREACPA